jgi:hypothetical protein
MVRHIALLCLLTACSSSDDGGAPPPPATTGKVGEIRQPEVWKDGLELAGKISIYPGATVEIEPGARIKCSPSSEIVIGGVFRVKSAGKHATITCPQWPGLTVAEGGTLDVEGLDIENAEVGVTSGNKAALVTLTDSSILTTIRPVLVNPGSLVTLTRVVATTPTTLGPGQESKLEVRGKLVAKYLDYESNTNEGIWLSKDGEAEIEDSTLKSKNGLDVISSRDGKSLKVSYTTMRGGHCGLHMQGIGSLTVDHVTSEENLFGITIYGASVEGPHSVKDSNFSGLASWIDMQGDHGPIKFENVYTDGTETVKNTDPPKVTKAPAKIANAQPR